MLDKGTLTVESTAPLPANADRLSAPLMERMDPSIGEASSVMGAMITEMIRRSLRGGVLHLGEELGSYVAEQVTTTLHDQTPLIEQVAAEAADSAARIAATEVAKEEVGLLHEKTRAADERLAVQIDETARAADAKTAEVARDLAGRLAESEQNVNAKTVQAAQDLTAQIELTEKRVTETTRTELNLQMEQLREKSRKGIEILMERIRTLETTLKDQNRQLAEQEAARRLAESALRSEVEQRSAAQHQEHHERTSTVHATLESLIKQNAKAHRDELEAVRQANAALHARTAELEKPRGFRKLWRSLAFWQKKG